MNIILKGQKELQKQLKKYNDAIKKGEVRAINTTLRSVKTQSTKLIGKEINLKASVIKEKLKETRADKNKIIAKLETPKRGIQLRRFFVKQLVKKGKTVPVKQAGIAVKVKKKGRQKKMPGAFLIRLKGRGTGYGIAMRRKGAKGRKNYKVLYASSISQIFNNVIDQIKPTIQKDLKKRMINDINFYIGKIK